MESDNSPSWLEPCSADCPACAADLAVEAHYESCEICRDSDQVCPTATDLEDAQAYAYDRLFNDVEGDDAT